MAKKIKETKVKEETNDRKAKLNELLRQTNKDLGIENAVRFGEDTKEWEKLSTGVKEFDELLGGGFPYGHFSVIWGGESAGKTSLCYTTIAEAQKLGKIVYYINLEQSFDRLRAEHFGVNVDELIIGEFPKAEVCLDTIIKYAREKIVDVIVLDSIHSLSPKAEQENKKGDKSLENENMALIARKLSEFFRQAMNPIAQANIAVILVGQTRTSVGFIAFEQLTGGHALKHYSVLTINVRRGAKADAPKVKGEIVGFDCQIKINKTKTPGTKTELTEIHIPYYFEEGFKNEK
jgi:recombination protein RecA